MVSGDAIWEDWYSVAGPLNKLTAWFTFGLSVLWWALFPAKPGGYLTDLLVRYLPGFICGILAGMFYLIILQEKIESQNLDKEMHIWLWICFVLSWFTLGGIFIWVQFALVGVLSDRPFWRVLREKYHYY
ncbi:MAG: hypothetical protein HWN66_11475 [Candidatus Helarchaeota archaeon]|nr:hypothetical protein [Candidatus Helarchaeota archaeon]